MHSNSRGTARPYYAVDASDNSVASDGWSTLQDNSVAASDGDSATYATYTSQKSLLDTINIVQEDISVKPMRAVANVAEDRKPKAKDNDDGAEENQQQAAAGGAAAGVSMASIFSAQLIAKKFAEKIKKTVAEDVKPNITQTIEQTQTMLQAQVASIQSTTQTTIDSVSRQSKRASAAFQEKAVEPLQKKTQETVEAIGKSSRQVVEEQVVPKWQAVQDTTRATVDTHIRPHVERGSVLQAKIAPYYVGNAQSFVRLYSYEPPQDKEDDNVELETRAVVIEGEGPVKTDQDVEVAITSKPKPKDQATRQWIHFAGVMLEATMRACGRVVFCNNPITGLIIFLTLTVAHPWLALSAFACGLSTNVIAHHLQLGTEQITSGHLATCSVLLGAACVGYFDVTEWKAVASSVFLGAPMVLTTTLVLQQKLGSELPLLHLPYNVVLLALLLASVSWNQFSIIRVVLVDEIQMESTIKNILTGIWKSTWCGIGMIFLAPQQIWVGIVIWCSILLYSRIVAVSMLLASFLASLGAAVLIGIPPGTLHTGLISYNAALSVGAIVSYQRHSSLAATCLMGFFAIVWTGIAQSSWNTLFSFIANLSMPLTVPFCAAAFLHLMIGTMPSSPIGSVPRENAIDIPPEDDLSTPRPTEEDADGDVPLVPPAAISVPTQSQVGVSNQKEYGGKEETKSDNYYGAVEEDGSDDDSAGVHVFLDDSTEDAEHSEHNLVNEETPLLV